MVASIRSSLHGLSDARMCGGMHVFIHHLLRDRTLNLGALTQKTALRGDGGGGAPAADTAPRLPPPPVPKAQSDKCVPDRDPRWEVLEVTKKAVASPRILSLAKPRVRKDLNEGYDPSHVSPAALVAQASPRLYELATPKTITKKA